jgi:putative hydrolases of HD superfamily
MADDINKDIVAAGASDDGVAEIARYVYEVGHLKSTPRSGWSLAGITQPESVADHVSRVAVIGFILAHMENADPWKTTTICIFHDNAETRLGDIPSVGKKYFPAVSEVDVVRDQVKGVPTVLAGELVAIAEEYCAGESIESRLANDADKLECLVQALEYEEAGADLATHWVESMVASLQSESAIALGRALRSSSPSQWWRSFVENYRH